MTQHFVARTLCGVTLDSADATQKEVLEGALKAVGFIPNMYANMVNVPGVLSTYLHGYAAFRQKSGLTPAEQEVVFLAISQQNGCNYCTAAHSMLADKMSGVPAPVLAAIRSGQPIPDARLQALYSFTQELVKTAGKPGQAVADAFLAAGYTEATALQVILAAAVKTLSNYTNHLFQTEVDDKFAAYKVA
ncbi:carboxymuconolactone decarboxylase family protein [Sulfuritalea sp.]|uniref:carboxymuconolactone decarboxylase family protein n=1 Tax=Sulfuritalea sp. TaxID=2480090 RepID=UPI00286E352A|nr:carboxymuconolactone decarboxylase family protein [Sulfuritalea sp.]